MKLACGSFAAKVAAPILGIALLTLPVAAETVLKASHQFPGGKGDPRDEMVQIIAKEVEKANVGLKIQIFPGSSLFKPKEQWNGMSRGVLDMSAFPLDYASGQHPEFSATLMPGLVGSYDRAKRLNDSDFMKSIKKVINDDGVVVIADAWLSGGFASKKSCVKGPDSLKGQVTRAAGPAFEQMLAAAGASISSMPSNEIYNGLQTGVLDATNTSSASFVSFRLYEQVKCLTAPGENTLWFMYEPVLMSKKSWDKLTKEQQDAITTGAKKAEEYFDVEGRKTDQEVVDTFKKAGVEVTEMTKADYDAWLAVAKESAYKKFAEEVKGGDKLIESALAVK